MGVTDWLAIAGAVGGVAAAIFGALAWLATRQRQPFAIRRQGQHVLLTRVRRPTVQIRMAYVFGHSVLVTDDQAVTSEWRYLPRDAHLVLTLDIRDADGEPVANVLLPHETLTVRYRLIWPWENLLRRVRREDEEAAQQRLDERFDWREWRASML
ncbi:hypothetical protein [Nocardia farcinica]|uniref:hypothetical protein n=1 Tax=Nocardia farcinica TaxID=37329 RepID=UPI00245909F1|nr:hypothetical protein [Nocardia farcinica]